MMPIDPYFTSGDKSLEKYRQERDRKRAVAKALQFKLNTGKYPAKNRKTALRHMAETPQDQLALKFRIMNKIAHGPFLMQPNGGGPSLTGFKQPRKVWTHKKGTSSN